MILAIFGDSKIVYLLLGIIILIVLTVLGVRIFLERRKDQEEIEEIISNLVEAKPRQEEVKEVSEVEKKSNIEEVLAKMQQDLNTKPEDVVASFEQEQEEKSIISYQELVRTKKGPTTSAIKEPKLEKQLDRSERPKKKFKNTDFISPIYGKLEEHFDYPTVPAEQKEQVKFDFSKSTEEFETTLEELKEKEQSIHHYLNDFKGSMEIDHLEQTLTPLSKELQKNDEFLEALKEFRKNLD